MANTAEKEEKKKKELTPAELFNKRATEASDLKAARAKNAEDNLSAEDRDRGYSFEGGEGRELIGSRGGKKLYSSMEDVYGAPKPSLDRTMAETPSDALTDRPVMIKNQSPDEQRAAYQRQQSPRAVATQDSADAERARVRDYSRPAPLPVQGSGSREYDAREKSYQDMMKGTDDAIQAGKDKLSIREGTASKSTRDKYPGYEPPVTREDLESLARTRGTPVTSAELMGFDADEIDPATNTPTQINQDWLREQNEKYKPKQAAVVIGPDGRPNIAPPPNAIAAAADRNKRRSPLSPRRGPRSS
jgi:hypothetical protein